MNEAEQERIQLVLSTLSTHLLTAGAAFPAVVAAVMELAARYTDMSGPQRRALVRAVMEEIAQNHVAEFAPFLPLVETLCDTMVEAARQGFRFRPRGGPAACFPCCRGPLLRP